MNKSSKPKTWFRYGLLKESKPSTKAGMAMEEEAEAEALEAGEAKVTSVRQYLQSILHHLQRVRAKEATG